MKLIDTISNQFKDLRGVVDPTAERDGEWRSRNLWIGIADNGLPFVFGDQKFVCTPNTKPIAERWSLKQIIGVPNDLPNAEILAMFRRSIWAMEMGGKPTRFATWGEFCRAQRTMAGFIIR